MKNLKRILTLALVAVISITSLQLSGVVDAEGDQGEQEEVVEETTDETEEQDTEGEAPAADAESEEKETTDDAPDAGNDSNTQRDFYTDIYWGDRITYTATLSETKAPGLVGNTYYIYPDDSLTLTAYVDGVKKEFSGKEFDTSIGNNNETDKVYFGYGDNLSQRKNDDGTLTITATSSSSFDKYSYSGNTIWIIYVDSDKNDHRMGRVYDHSYVYKKIMVDNIFICLSDGSALNDNYSFTGYTTSRTEEILPINSKYEIKSVASSDESVATVSYADGKMKVTAKSIGATYISATDVKGNTAKALYRVVNPTPANSTGSSTASSGSTSTYHDGSYQSLAAAVGDSETLVVAGDGYAYRAFKAQGSKDTSVTGADGLIPSGSKFTSTTIEPTSTYYIQVNEAIEKYWADEYQSYTRYEIGAVIDFDIMSVTGAAVHQLDGYVTVSLPIPEGITLGENQVLRVYRMEDDGTFTACETATANGIVAFATNHFSTYVFMVEDATASASAQTTATSPKTGEE